MAISNSEGSDVEMDFKAGRLEKAPDMLRKGAPYFDAELLLSLAQQHDLRLVEDGVATARDQHRLDIEAERRLHDEHGLGSFDLDARLVMIDWGIPKSAVFCFKKEAGIRWDGPIHLICARFPTLSASPGFSPGDGPVYGRALSRNRLASANPSS